MLVWSLINCLIPVLPAILIWFGLWLGTRSNDRFRPLKTITVILGDGQLFFYSISLCAATISDLLYKIGQISIDKNISLTPEVIEAAIAEANKTNNKNLTAVIILSTAIIAMAIFYGQVIRINLQEEDEPQILIKTTLISLLISVIATVYVLFARADGGLF